MNRMMKNLKGKMKKVKEFVSVKRVLLTTYVMSMMYDMTLTTAYADEGAAGGAGGAGAAGGAEAKWDTVINFVTPWITRLGGVVILIGAVEFGLSFKNDDAEGKTKGMRTIIAGCIVTAVGLSADIFLA